MKKKKKTKTHFVDVRKSPRGNKMDDKTLFTKIFMHTKPLQPPPPHEQNRIKSNTTQHITPKIQKSERGIVCVSPHNLHFVE
jgi:hypothetical protein